MAVDDLYTLTVHYSSLGGCMSFSCDYKQLTGTNDELTLSELVTNWLTANQAALVATLSDQVEVDQVVACPQSGVDEVPGQTNLDAVVGTNASPAFPNNVAAIISQLTDAPSSNANGRIFLGGMPELALVNGVFSAGFVTVLQTLASLLDDDVAVTGPPAATFRPVVISRYLGGIKRPSPIGHDIIAATAKAQAKQQRRRTTRRFGLGA